LSHCIFSNEHVALDLHITNTAERGLEKQNHQDRNEEHKKKS
jgi:hypothetical protein